MDREPPHRQAGFNQREFRASDPIGSRPDRVAFWALVMALVVLLAAAGTGRAAQGGVTPETGGSGEAKASFYGPGLYGNEMACGEQLTRAFVGVAHRTLPCGTKVTFRYRGRTLRTAVVDRGPFVKGIDWDLTSAAAAKLRLTYTDVVRATVGR